MSDLFDRIETRRFVGREFLLWLWFQSELFDSTFETKAHGSFGLWVEGRLALGGGRESTAIKGSTPGQHREAKESLRRGKMPAVAGLHLSWAGREASFVLKAESLALSGLVLPAVLQPVEDTPALAPPPRRKKRRAESVAEEAEREADGSAEEFFDRMARTREIEDLLTALYRDFLTVRLSPAWARVVEPAIHAWIAGDEVDEAEYRRKIAQKPRRPVG